MLNLNRARVVSAGAERHSTVSIGTSVRAPQLAHRHIHIDR